MARNSVFFRTGDLSIHHADDLLPVFSAFTTSITQMIPFTHFRRPVGLFGIGSLTGSRTLLLSVIHSVRLYRRMLHMELEETHV